MNQRDERWAAKRAWHASQRALPVERKIEIMVELQRRQVTINGIKASLGRPPVPMRVWGEPA